MTRLSDFFITFCVSAVFIGALLIICPNGKISKSVKYVLSLAFTLIIISSALKIDFDFNLKPDTEAITIHTEALEVKSAEYVYSHCLKAANIQFSKISVLTNKTNDDRIVISKVLIFSKEDKNKIFLALSAVAQNFEVEIINE
jgi:hypothetical protein